MNFTVNSNAASHKQEESFLWWVAAEGYFDPIAGVCSSTIFEDYSINYPILNSSSRWTFAMVDWGYSNNMMVFGDNSISYFSGSSNVFNKSLTRDYDVLVSPSWVWQSYESNSAYTYYIGGNGLTAKTSTSFVVLDAIVPTRIINNEMVY